MDSDLPFTTVPGGSKKRFPGDEPLFGKKSSIVNQKDIDFAAKAAQQAELDAARKKFAADVAAQKAQAAADIASAMFNSPFTGVDFDIGGGKTLNNMRVYGKKGALKNFSKDFRASHPRACGHRDMLRKQARAAGSAAGSRARATVRPTLGIPDVTCARSRTTQAKLLIRGVQSILASSPQCQEKYRLTQVLNNTASRATSAATAEAYARLKAAAGIPDYLRCK
jgi:hypothetical protein